LPLGKLGLTWDKDCHKASWASHGTRIATRQAGPGMGQGLPQGKLDLAWDKDCH